MSKTCQEARHFLMALAFNCEDPFLRGDEKKIETGLFIFLTIFNAPLFNRLPLSCSFAFQIQRTPAEFNTNSCFSSTVDSLCKV